jgi:aldose 1-epimerase
MAFGLLMSLALAGARYTARSSPDRIEIADRTAGIVVSINPSAGNIATSMKVNGHEFLWWTAGQMSGIPFVGPWANRLDEQAFYANGKKYTLNMELGNVRGAHPIHGFLSATDRWRVVEARADRSSAWVTSRLEFFREPSWMKQWPFAHTIEMTYRLQNGVLEVATSIANQSTEPMPIAIGFHPYFQLTDSPRDEWTISVGAKTHWKLAANKVPTGETEPIENFVPNPQAAALKDYNRDDVCSDPSGTRWWSATPTVAVRAAAFAFGPNYRAAVVWAPKGRPFICFSSWMAGITDAMNLRSGLYKELGDCLRQADPREFLDQKVTGA